MSFIEHILSYFGYFKIKEEKQETTNAISNIIWGVGFNLTEEYTDGELKNDIKIGNSVKAAETFYPSHNIKFSY